MFQQTTIGSQEYTQMYLSGALQKKPENYLDKYSDTHSGFLTEVEDNSILCIICTANTFIVINSSGNIVFNESMPDNIYMPGYRVKDNAYIVHDYLPIKNQGKLTDLRRKYFGEFFDEHIPPPRIFRNSLHETILGKIDELIHNDYDWDEIGYKEPTEENIKYAKSYMSKFITNMSLKGYKIFVPYISNSENGGTNLKWNKGDKVLYFEILYKDDKYTKVWDIEDKTVVETKELVEDLYTEIWEWLIGNG